MRIKRPPAAAQSIVSQVGKIPYENALGTYKSVGVDSGEAGDSKYLYDLEIFVAI